MIALRADEAVARRVRESRGRWPKEKGGKADAARNPFSLSPVARGPPRLLPAPRRALSGARRHQRLARAVGAVGPRRRDERRARAIGARRRLLPALLAALPPRAELDAGRQGRVGRPPRAALLSRVLPPALLPG